MASLETVQALLDELIQQAKSGAIIPIRLPGQLESIQDALRQIKEAPTEKPTASEDGEGEKLDPVAEAMQDQAKFISHAIHELRTPMTSIRGYGDMLNSMGALNDMQKQFVDTIRVNARRMEGLLTDVSDTSKIRGSTLRYTLKMDMFKNIAMMVEKQMQPIAEGMEQRTLTFEVPQGLPLLNTDGELMAKAINKLVENALRYCEESCIVTVSAHAEGNSLVIVIKDNGIGMKPEEIAQLGTIFFRSENEVVRSYKGSGLGIPIAYGIIKTLGGTIGVTSAPGEGTTFTITLPGMS